MGDLFLNSHLLIYLFSELVLYILLCIAFLYTVPLLRYWDIERFDARQFRLEKQAYLVMSVIFFVCMVKLFSTPYFLFTLESLSPLIPGAMCAAGVIAANDFGYPLLYLKIAILFLSGSWIFINSADLKASAYPYFTLKSWLFVLIFLLVSLELFLDIAYFSTIDTSLPVSCCSAIYTAQSGTNTLPLGLHITTMLWLFYLLYGLILLSNINRYDSLHIVANVLFLVVSYYAIVYFFGTYVYELPSHECPFCMFQREYSYVGYLIWGSLLLGTFLGLNSSILKLLTRNELKSVYNLSLVFNTLCVGICTLYVTVYYLKNGVFL